MSKIVVVFKSKYGSTEKYAKWITEELKADLYEISEIKPHNLLDYETIIYGGGLYASGINGISFITNNFNLLKDKNIIVFTVGLSPTEDKSIFEPIIKKNFKEEMIEKIKFFHLRGGIDYKKLGFTHKIMMEMLKKIVSKKKEEEMTIDDKAFLETYGDKVDFTDKKTIKQLIDYVKSL